MSSPLTGDEMKPLIDNPAAVDQFGGEKQRMIELAKTKGVLS
jgi:hypothetical protein